MSVPQMEDITQLHMFPHRDYYLGFHPDTFSLFRISTALFTAIHGLQHGAGMSHAAAVSRIRECDLMHSLEKIQQRISHERGSVKPTLPGLSHERPMALSIHVSNACNLRCTYCYAEGGSYGRRPQKKMDKALAVRALDTMYRNFPDVESILFFGGEPMLAMDVIETVCQHVKDLNESGKARRLPEYAMVTNGTLVDDEAIRIIRKYGIRVTMSVDGPPVIHDQLRPRRDGAGTYGLVKCGFDRMVADIGRAPDIEATYTRLHLESGMGMQDLAAFLHKEFLFKVGAIVPVHLPKEHPLALSDDETNGQIESTVDGLFEDLIKGDSPKVERALLAPMLLFLSKRSTRFLCSVGQTRLTITTDGEIYPCQRLIRRPFLMGTIDDFDISHPSRQFRDALDRLAFCDKHRNPLCERCWAKVFCFGCPGSDTFANNNYQISEWFCGEMRKLIEGNLGALYEIKSDPHKWSGFLAGLQNLADRLRQVSSAVDIC
jgi:uncharacterized protein